ncbi:MAG: hypothetical protein EOM22_02170 [Gammaproteobacteria bacterium]|nr:hypothetical protein [Gammaproteobacteria bacterium]
MSGGAIKGLEVLLIAGGVFWFAYTQMKALKQPTPGAEKQGAETPGTERDGEAETRSTDGDKPRDQV